MKEKIQRLEYLSSISYRSDEQQEELRPVVELAKSLTQSPLCEINVVDAFSRITLAGGMDEFKVIPKQQSICRHTVLKDETYEITDLQKDERYREHFFVQDEPYIRYYCGAQLNNANGVTIGSLCVLDTETKQLTDGQKSQLRYLADIVAQKLENQQQLRQNKSDLAELEQQFHTLNHALRSPINGITGMADMVKRNENAGDEIIKKVQIMKDCAKTITEEVESSLEVLEEHSSDSSEEHSSVSDVIQKISNLYQPQAEQKELSLRINKLFDQDLTFSETFGIKLIRIVGNLVANALKFTPHGGMVEAEFDISKSGDTQQLQLTVSDTGTGMDEDQIQAFNKKKSVQSVEGTDGEKGYGIGLKHVRNLITEENGTAKVQSSDGTQFKVTLPTGSLAE